jgi:hypothetical protein
LHISTANDPPRNFRYASVCPRLDHLVPGRGPVTPRKTHAAPRRPCGRLRACCFRYGFPCVVSLATGPHSLARSSKRTTGHWHHVSYCTLAGVSFNVEFLSCPCRSIAIRFQALLTSLSRVLFSFRSLYYCAIGLEALFSLGGGCPPVSREISDPRYSRSGHVLFCFAYGAITRFGPPFQGSYARRRGSKRPSYNTTSPFPRGEGFGLGWAVFTRRY